MTTSLYLTIDISDAIITEEEKLTKTPQLDFAHEIVYSLNRTSLWQFGRIHAFLESEQMTIEISPALSVPSSLKEFRHLIKDVMMGREVKSGNINLLKIRTDAPKLPKVRYTVDPYAKLVINPQTMNDESVTLCLSLNTEAGRNTHACFSNYPLPCVNQCLNVVSSMERRSNIA